MLTGISWEGYCWWIPYFWNNFWGTWLWTSEGSCQCGSERWALWADLIERTAIPESGGQTKVSVTFRPQPGLRGHKQELISKSFLDHKSVKGLLNIGSSPWKVLKPISKTDKGSLICVWVAAPPAEHVWESRDGQSRRHTLRSSVELWHLSSLTSNG